MSKQPHKQRAETRDADLHERHKHVRSTLSKELREEHGVRRVRVNQGDTVEIMRGDFAGEEDEVVAVDLRDAVVNIEDVTTEKADGEEVPKPIDASNLKVTNLDLSDERRRERIQERGGDRS
jgi:large subunit ribosomal protein L24